MAVEIISCSEETELHRHYCNQTSSQPTYIELDVRDRTLLADYDAEIGSAIPVSVSHGFERRYTIPLLTGSAANRMMEEIAPQAQRIVEDWDEVWDGNNMVAVLGEDAQAAETEIRELLGCDETYDVNCGFASSDIVAEWGIDGATNGDEEREYGITAETDDDRLADIEAEILADLASVSDSGVAVCSGLASHLRNIRDELVEQAQADTEVIWSVMSGESPGARAVEPGPVGVTVPDDVLTWAEGHGLSMGDPGVYLLVTPQDEAEDDMTNEIDWVKGTLSYQDVRKIRAELASPN